MGNYSINGLNQMATENEVATVLSHFNSSFIYDVIDEKLRGRFNLAMSIQNANMVVAFEQNFKDLAATYPSDIKNIETVRTETYREIVDMICAYYGIQYALPPIEESPTVDYYTVAYYLYDFLVYGFFIYISKFYARYIYANKDQIYDSMGLDAYKKNKDSSTLYGKKVFSDVKIAVISAYIMTVVKNMESFDISIENILTVIYGDANIVALLASIINNMPMDFFKTYFKVPMEVEAIMYTNIRLELTRLSSVDNNIKIF